MNFPFCELSVHIFYPIFIGNFPTTKYSSFVGYRLENIFSQSMVWLLTLLMVFLVVQKFVCFMKSISMIIYGFCVEEITLCCQKDIFSLFSFVKMFAFYI